MSPKINEKKKEQEDIEANIMLLLRTGKTLSTPSTVLLAVFSVCAVYRCNASDWWYYPYMMARGGGQLYPQGVPSNVVAGSYNT